MKIKPMGAVENPGYYRCQSARQLPHGHHEVDRNAPSFKGGHSFRDMAQCERGHIPSQTAGLGWLDVQAWAITFFSILLQTVPSRALASLCINDPIPSPFSYSLIQHENFADVPEGSPYQLLTVPCWVILAESPSKFLFLLVADKSPAVQGITRRASK